MCVGRVAEMLRVVEARLWRSDGALGGVGLVGVAGMAGVQVFMQGMGLLQGQVWQYGSSNGQEDGNIRCRTEGLGGGVLWGEGERGTCRPLCQCAHMGDSKSMLPVKQVRISAAWGSPWGRPLQTFCASAWHRSAKPKSGRGQGGEGEEGRRGRLCAQGWCGQLCF